MSMTSVHMTTACFVTAIVDALLGLQVRTVLDKMELWTG